VNRKQLLKELKKLGIHKTNIDPTPVQINGVPAIRLANNAGQETYFTSTDVFGDDEWTEANEQRENWLKEHFS